MNVSRSKVSSTTKWAPYPWTHGGRACDAHAMQAAFLHNRRRRIIVEIVPTHRASQLLLLHFLAFTRNAVADIRACLALDTAHPHAQNAIGAQMYRIEWCACLAACARLTCHHVDALFAQQFRAMLARVDALEAMYRFTVVAYCAAIGAYAPRTLVAQRGAAQRTGAMHSRHSNGCKRAGAQFFPFWREILFFR